MPDQDSVSQEAKDRKAFDELKQQLADSKVRAEKAEGALTALMKRDAARDALEGKVANPGQVSDLIAHQLADVELKDVAAHVVSEGFAPKLAAFVPAIPPPTLPPDGDAGEEVPAVEQPHGFNNPSPGTANGTQPLTGQTPIVAGSKEFDALIASGDRDAVEKAYKENRIISPTRPYQ